MPVSRRQLLAAAPLLLSACARPRNLQPRVQTPALKLPPVTVDPARVIRTTVGLRPFRPSGFVVRTEKLDAKTVIHNYGHGGAGITLSWGTAELALNLASSLETRQAAVIGCGAVGLSTARLLQQRGYQVTIYSKAMPPDTTSNLAGGLWDPVTVFDAPSLTPQFRGQLIEASRIAFRRYQSLAGERYGVRWLPLFRLSDESSVAAPNPESPYAEINLLYPAARQLSRQEHPFHVPYVYQRYSMLIEPAIYLNALTQDFLIASGRIVVREFQTPRDLASITESLIFNCTGLGAGALFNDSEITPIRGQLSFLLPQPEVQYMTVGPADIYMFPRQDGILLGGSHERGVWDTTVDETTKFRILRDNAALFNRMPSV